jgi:hypothetical protein
MEGYDSSLSIYHPPHEIIPFVLTIVNKEAKAEVLLALPNPLSNKGIKIVGYVIDETPSGLRGLYPYDSQVYDYVIAPIPEEQQPSIEKKVSGCFPKAKLSF